MATPSVGSLHTDILHWRTYRHDFRAASNETGKKPNMLLGGVRRSTPVGGSANRHRRSGLCCRITATFATRSM